MKKTVQRECHKAHDRYVADLITSNDDHVNKHFWTYIKGKRIEQYRIPSIDKDYQIYSDDTSKANNYYIK